jgi:hypothetical protein
MRVEIRFHYEPLYEGKAKSEKRKTQKANDPTADS